MTLLTTVLGSLVIVGLVIIGIRDVWREVRKPKDAQTREGTPADPAPSPPEA